MKDVRELLPVHVLWRGVVEIFCGNNEGCKKYSMQRARDTYNEIQRKNELTYAMLSQPLAILGRFSRRR